MAYINAAVEPIENAIRAGTMTIEQGTADFANRIFQAEEVIKEDEANIQSTEETLKAIDSALETMRKESEWLSSEISNLRWEEISAHRDGDESTESGAQTMADHYEKQRDELNAQIQELNQERDKMYGVKYDEEQKLSNDRMTLSNLQADKAKFDLHCEEIRAENARMGEQRDLIKWK